MASDEVASKVAGDLGHLQSHGAVRLRGYVLELVVMVEPFTDGVTIAEAEPDDPTTIRVYTSALFDRWIDVPYENVRHRLQDTEGRSLVWIDANAVVTVGHARLAANIGPSMEITDEPTTYPPWPP